MKHVGQNIFRPDRETWTQFVCLALLSLFVASCGGSSGGDARTPAPPGNDASLATLAIGDVTLEPAFSSSVSDYAAAVGFATKSTQVTAAPRDGNATVSVNGAAVASGAASDPVPLNEGNNTITVNVIAEDGTTTQTYTVSVARQSASAFTQTAYVKALDARVEDWFGARVALSGDGESLAVTAVGRENGLQYPVGVSCNEDPDFSRQGVFETARDGEGAWIQQPTVYSTGFARFGTDLALSADGSTLAVSASNVGRAHVFTRDSDVTWRSEASLYSSNWLRDSEVGIQVALSADGSTLAVGSVFGVDIFTRDLDSGWVQQAYLQAPGGVSSEGYGDLALAADGSTLAVAGWGELVGVYVFGRDSDGAWAEQTYDSSFSSGTRIALSADGSTLAVSQGAGVHLLTRDSGWAEQAHLLSSNGAALGRVALSADGTVLAAGAHAEASAATGVNGDGTDNSASYSGAAYVFTRDGGGAWTERAYVKASNTGVGDSFGFDVALSADGTVLAVGAPGERSAATGINGDGEDDSLDCSGAAYIFEL